MKAVVFLADGFEECEALIVVDILRRAGIETVMASVTGTVTVDSSRHVKVAADSLAHEIDYESVDIIILPGGRLGTENLQKSQFVLDKCKIFSKTKIIAAICAAPSILASLGLVDNRNVTCHPDYEQHMGKARVTGKRVTIDKNIITGQGLGASFEFAFTIVEILRSREDVDAIKDAICYSIT